MFEQLRVLSKKLLSYTKKTWDIHDYPLRYRKQTDAGQSNTEGLKPWVVQVVNWWTMTGLGDTRQEALENLKTHFKNYTENNQPPRPGTQAPLIFADTARIDQLEDIAQDFFEQILEVDYYDCFISDESSLTDFGKDDEETLQHINRVYNLGLTELGDGNIVRLLTLIKEKQ